MCQVSPKSVIAWISQGPTIFGDICCYPVDIMASVHCEYKLCVIVAVVDAAQWHGADNPAVTEPGQL